MLITSRSLSEYRAFFALSTADLATRIVDCAAGASGFAAQANAAGAHVTAVDPAYGAGVDELRDTALESNRRGMAIVDDHEGRFVWTWYGDRASRQTLRDEARAAFVDDLAANPATYVAGALPELLFDDDAFDLALCSHLLFTWSDVFDEEWHHRALLDMLRVAPRVRVFPLVQQATGDPVAFLPSLLDRLRKAGHEAKVVGVPYEFQRGGNQMLTLRRRAAGD